MVNYGNSRIYKLANDVDNKIYVGSTTMPLSKRMVEHRHSFKKQPERTVYKHFHLIGGLEHVSIILIENFPCASREELLKRERYWMEELNAELNHIRPILTIEEIREDNKINCKKYRIENKEYVAEQMRQYRMKNIEYFDEQRKKYYHTNKEYLAERMKQYRQENKEYLVQHQKQHYQENKELIKEKARLYRRINVDEVRKRDKKRYTEQRSLKVRCEYCNKSVAQCNFTQHEQTATHIENFILC